MTRAAPRRFICSWMSVTAVESADFPQHILRWRNDRGCQRRDG